MRSEKNKIYIKKKGGRTQRKTGSKVKQKATTKKAKIQTEVEKKKKRYIQLQDVTQLFTLKS